MSELGLRVRGLDQLDRDVARLARELAALRAATRRVSREAQGARATTASLRAAIARAEREGRLVRGRR